MADLKPGDKISVRCERPFKKCYEGTVERVRPDGVIEYRRDDTNGLWCTCPLCFVTKL